ncbi:LysM peptidoglycan-binding domain-containing protein [Alkalibacterium sp. f15]|uniref:LysM peptidoglycan-binding domain-containing protein n=1 Tax=Alkalibacterium sp. f15 TaxID=3414029 RepID=UPI003BF88620
MGKKDRKSMEELWSKRFDEEAEHAEDEPLSRKAKREREKSISPILTVTLIFLALIIILPISAYLWWSSIESLSEEPTGPSIEQVMDNNDDDEVEEQLEEDEEINDSEDDELNLVDSDEEESSANVEAEEADENSDDSVSSGEEEDIEDSVSDGAVSENTPETNTPDNAQNQEIESSNQSNQEENIEESSATAEAESTPENVPAENVNSYTVKSGDNMYRIALNHGMTTNELMQLNNIQDDTVHIGQELRVE